MEEKEINENRAVKEQIIEKIKEELKEYAKETFKDASNEKINDINIQDGNMVDFHKIEYSAIPKGERGTSYNFTRIACFLPDKILEKIKKYEDFEKELGENFKSISDDWKSLRGWEYSEKIYSQSGKRLVEYMNEKIEKDAERIDDDIIKNYMQEKYMWNQKTNEGNFVKSSYGDTRIYPRGSTLAVEEYMRKFGDMNPETLEFKKEMTIDYLIDRINNQMDLDGIERGNMHLEDIEYIEKKQDGIITLSYPLKKGTYQNYCYITISPDGKTNITGNQTSPELRVRR